jgi:predicted component of type VI protein secretion system
MLSAVVVNKQHINSGDMEPDTLKGFIGAAQELGYKIDDSNRFLREQQEKCFEVAIRDERPN